MSLTSTLPITNVINVTIQDTPSGLSSPNVNSVALFTNEAPNNINAFGIYVSPTQVATDYGTNSVTAAMANAVFAQSPNILSGDGRLVIIPLLASVSATAGKVVTPDISANLAGLIAVADGTIRVTINGTINNVTGLNLTKCLTLADVASKLQDALPAGVSVTATSTQITINSNKVGSTSTVTLASIGTGTDLYGNSYLKGATATATAGANSSGETILQAITRTSGLVDYTPVMTNLNLEDTAISTIATGIQALDNLFFHHCSATSDIAGIATTISAASDKKTRLVLYTPSQATANLMKAAYVGRACSVDFTGSNTLATMNLKSLANITPDTGITQTNYVAAGTAGIDLYVSIAGVASVYPTGGNDYFDNQYANLALKFALEVAGFNYLRQTNTKVPQTEMGMNGLKAAYSVILEQYVRNGEIAADAWNSSETFGDPVIFKNNITQNGYYIYSLPVALQSSVDRNARKAPLVQIAVKRAGAIQSSNVIVLINN